MASDDRRRRVETAIRDVLSNAIPSLKDPRIGFVTITGVRVTKDLAEAKVYVSVLGDERGREKSIERLRAAHGVLQGAVARALGLRKTPILSFEYDPAIERGIELTKLIDELAPREPDAEQ